MADGDPGPMPGTNSRGFELRRVDGIPKGSHNVYLKRANDVNLVMDVRD
jgi:hypothetical protein